MMIRSLLFGLTFLSSGTWLNAAEHPNVILIFADDLGYGDLGCQGATKVSTPHIDRIAREGRRFLDVHSASAVCTPSRYGLLTGEYPFRKDIWGPCSHTAPLLIDPGKLTLASMFHRQGYATACFGKWHLGFGTGRCDWNKPLRPGPLELGFEHYFGVPKVNSGFPFVFVEDDRIAGWDPEDPLIFGVKPFTPTRVFPSAAGIKSANRFSGARRAHQLYDDERIATILAERAVKWIETVKPVPDSNESRRPFFLYLPTTNIHHPCTPAPRFKGTSQCGLYGDFIHELDWVVGQILECLDRNGLAENTIVIFTSDNGGMFNHPGQNAFQNQHRINGGLLGFKFGVWEGGHRVPFLVRWPGHVPSGTVSNQLFGHIDLLATLASVLGLELEDRDRADSLNVLSAWMGSPDQPVRDHLVLAPHQKSHLSLRSGQWMYIPRRGSGGFTGTKPGQHTFAGPAAASFVGSVNSDFLNGRLRDNAPSSQLYDLGNDRAQTTNLHDRHPDLVRKLDLLLKSYQRAIPTPRGQPGAVAKAYDGFEPLGKLRFNFESGKLGTWRQVKGRAEIPVASRRSLPRWKEHPYCQEGSHYLSTVTLRDGATDQQQVVFESPVFTMSGEKASFLVSGGFDPESLHVALMDARTGEKLLSAGGSRGPQMRRIIWNVKRFRGRPVRLRVVDQNTEGWGHLNFDDFSVDGSVLP